MAQIAEYERILYFCHCSSGEKAPRARLATRSSVTNLENFNAGLRDIATCLMYPVASAIAYIGTR